MRLATIATPRGLRLHVRARSGYVDVGDEAGDPALASLRGLLDAGPAAMDTVRGLLDRDGRDVRASEDFEWPASPSRGASCASE